MLTMFNKAVHYPFIRFKNTASCIFLVAFLLLTSACQKDEEIVPASETSTTEYSEDNNWILENMQLYYLWNEHIPANTDKTQAPESFFNSLLYTYDELVRPDGDRFSFIAQDASELEASLSGQEQTTGAEYTLYRVTEGSEEVIAQVMYVLPDSPAEKSGLKRGDIIYQVNGQTLNTTNYYSLLFEQTTVVAGLAEFQNNELVKTSHTISVTSEVVQENPILLDSIYVINSKAVGYLVYNQFIPGPNGSTVNTYDLQLDQIFSSFQAAGVSELILDLRYNPGGYVSSATHLASLIGKGIDETKVFYRQEWNQTLTPELTRAYGEDFFIEKFTTKTQNIGNQLSRVYVLTSGQTASASELVINGLKPYMEVITIGTTTVGKNVGSITITDDTGVVTWGLQPIVFKSYNSLGESDYTAGFAPTIEVNEGVELEPLGDIQETMLNAALLQITGAPTARLGVDKYTLPIAGSSIMHKAGGSNMFDSRIKELSTQ